MRLKNYLTEKRVWKSAVTPEGALDVAILHWKQNAQLTQKQLIKLLYTGCTPMSSMLCGLCYYYKNGLCAHCPLNQEGKTCYSSGSLYQKAVTHFNSFVIVHDKASFDEWHIAAVNLYEFLLNLKKGNRNET